MGKFCKCGRYLTDLERCNCKEFVVINEDLEETTINAYDEEGAAIEYADRIDENDCCVDEIVTVNGNKYKLSCEPNVNYYAEKIKE